MTQELDRETLADILQARDVETLTVHDLAALTRAEIDSYLPDGACRIDPRNGDRILYHSSRAGRPHDNFPSEQNSLSQRACVICQGTTTGVIDVADLSEGFTFINKNMFPIVYPFEDDDTARGLHFLQWTSSQHDRDWHNMARSDRVIVMSRLAALEKTLLQGSDQFPSVGQSGAGHDENASVIIIKNYGHLVGGSLMHGHQQIVLTNVLPRHFRDNARFEREYGTTFSSYMQRETPDDLVVKDYGSAVLVVPTFMRRPFDMILLFKDVSKTYLHQLDDAGLEAIADGWHDAIRAIREVMPEMGREIAYNVITSNGPGAGLYVEFLPYTQEIGGVEHLGLFVCQERPARAAERLRCVIL